MNEFLNIVDIDYWKNIEKKYGKSFEWSFKKDSDQLNKIFCSNKNRFHDETCFIYIQAAVKIKIA